MRYTDKVYSRRACERRSRWRRTFA